MLVEGESLMEIRRQGVAQATAVLTVGTLLTRALGFVREMAIAHQFGATAATDAYLVAFVIPGLFASVGISAITAAFIPVFTEYHLKHGEEEAWRITNVLITLSVGVLSLSAVFTFLLAPILIPVLGPGLDQQSTESAVRLARIMSPAIVFIGLIGLSTSILNAYKHFTLPAFSGALFNIGIITSTLVLGSRLGIAGVAIGVVAGTLAHLLVQSTLLMNKRHFYTPSFEVSHPGVKQMAWLLVPFLIGPLAGQLNVIVDRILASSLAEGSIAALGFASRMMDLPLGVFAASIAAAFYPTLAEQHALGDLDQLRKTFSEGIRMLWFIVVPISIGLIILREPLTRLLLERGAFDTKATGLTATALLFYAIGLFARAGNIMLIRLYWARKDVFTPVKFSVLTVGLNIALSIVLMRSLLHGGLALASSIAAGINLVLLGSFLRKRLRHIDGRRIAKSIAKIVLASSAMGGVCWQALHLSEHLFTNLGSLSQQFLQLIGVMVVGCLTYFGMALLLRMEQLSRVKLLLRSVIKRAS